MNYYYNTFDSRKFEKTDVISRYIQIISYQFEKKYQKPANDITIGLIDDNVFTDKITIRFRHKVSKEEITLNDLIK